MTTINEWFETLDSSQLQFIFPREFASYMESADPDLEDQEDAINAFLDEVESLWNLMDASEKLTIYKNFKAI